MCGALAQQLGVVPMALYKHVANKEELLDGMVDVIVGEIDPPVIEARAHWATSAPTRQTPRGRCGGSNHAVDHCRHRVRSLSAVHAVTADTTCDRPG
jgi:AcrR family transcriptional regulator